MINIQAIQPEIDTICRSLPIKRLDIFGSALTENFSSESDVDLLVMFDLKDDIDYFTVYFELKERLEELFNREVDLVVDKPFKNPIFKTAVERTRTIIYEP